MKLPARPREVFLAPVPGPFPGRLTKPDLEVFGHKTSRENRKSECKMSNNAMRKRHAR
jgi:hypothetical protein